MRWFVFSCVKIKTVLIYENQIFAIYTFDKIMNRQEEKMLFDVATGAACLAFF